MNNNNNADELTPEENEWLNAPMGGYPKHQSQYEAELLAVSRNGCGDMKEDKCTICGYNMVVVRPGKSQCDFCELGESYYEACKERDEARQEVERIKKLLLDPPAVFINFLHGKIAPLNWEQLERIHGPHPAIKERDEAREALKQKEAEETEKAEKAAVCLSSERALEIGRQAVANTLARYEARKLKEALDEARAALQRIADCDWVVTLPDRMDAVRKIARDALGGVR